MSQLSALAQMFGGFGGGHSNPEEAASYQAQLKQWLEDNEQAANLADSEQYANLGKGVREMIMNTPNMTDQEKAHRLLTLDAVSNMKMRTNSGVQSLNDALQSLMAGTANSAQLTDKLRNYNKAKQEGFDGDFMSYQKQTQAVPAHLQEAAALLTQSPEFKDALLTTMGKNPKTEGEVQSAKSTATQNAEVEAAGPKSAKAQEGKDVVEMLKATPNAIYGYNNIIENSNNVMKTLDSIEKTMKENPYSTGLFSDYLKKLPESSAMEVSNLIKTIEANNVLNGMQQARQNSPTGSTGFGALDLGERELLASAVRRLNQASSPEEIQSAMSEIRAHYEKARKQAHEQWKSDFDWNERNKNVAPLVYRQVGAAPEYKPWAPTAQPMSAADLARQELERRRGQ